MIPTAIIRLLAASAVLASVSPVAAQTRSMRDTATAYGARLTAKGVPADLNQNRVNNRIDNRLDNRLALRIERYRTESSNDPTAAYKAAQDDKSRTTPALTAGQQQATQQYEQQADTVK